MKRALALVFALLPAVAVANEAFTVTDASIPAAGESQSAAVSMFLANPTSTTVTLRGARSPVAQLIRLQHIAQTPEGLMQMEMLPRLTLPPHSTAVLVPGATELRLLNLAEPLRAGYETPLTLIFDDGSTKTIRLKIVE